MAALLSASALGVAPCRPCSLSRAQAAIGQRSLQAAPRQRLVTRAAPAASEVDADVKKVSEVEEFSDGPEVAPTTQQVQSFLNTLCDDTEILEMDLKMGTFQMYVRRSLGATAAPAPAPAAPAPSVVLSTSLPHQTVDEHGADESIDEALITVVAPKVGIFRRGKYAGGKRIGKGNVVNEGDQIKKGQPLGFVEQLGTFVVIEAPQAGEVVSFYVKDGDAVEYGQNVLDLAPFFGGHIIGDRKYA